MGTKNNETYTIEIFTRQDEEISIYDVPETDINMIVTQLKKQKFIDYAYNDSDTEEFTRYLIRSSDVIYINITSNDNT